MKAQVRTSFTARTVGKIDESHLLTGEQLESVRMMTSHDLDSGSPLTVLLIGQPTLRRRLRVGDMAASVILSFRVSQGCDLRRPVVDSVAGGTLAA